MTWQELGGISEVFYTHDRKFCFQRVGNYWRLYGGEDCLPEGIENCIECHKQQEDGKCYCQNCPERIKEGEQE